MELLELAVNRAGGGWETEKTIRIVYEMHVTIYSILTPQIKGNHRVKGYITYNPNHRAISYYHPWSVFRADSPDHKHILIQLVLYIRNLLSFDCGI